MWGLPNTEPRRKPAPLLQAAERNRHLHARAKCASKEGERRRLCPGGGPQTNQGSLDLKDVTVTYNLASGGDPLGQGIGGVYYLDGGTFTSDSSTVITKNHATTSDDNVAP